MIPIVISVPPYHLWEPPPKVGHLPAHGSDFGVFQQADVLGMKQVIYVKDEDGLYDRDPKLHDDATLIRKATLDEILASPPQTTIIDRVVFEAWQTSRNISRIVILNGLVKGNLTAALAGKDVGTVLTKEN